nr:nucleotidyltransferase domain-containing protein [Candidatus Njordarchaeum guaymaensis]
MTKLQSPGFQNELEGYCDRLARLYDQPTIILSGSTAVGEDMPWSDVDLIVIADFKKSFLERLEELAPPRDSRFNFEVIGYTPQEFIYMLDRLDIKAIEAVEEGIPVISNPLFFDELKRKLDQLKSMGLTKTNCTYRLCLSS